MNLSSLSSYLLYLLSRHQDIPQPFIFRGEKNILPFIPFIFPFGVFGKLFGQPPSSPHKEATSMKSHLLWMILPNPGETVLKKRYPASISFSNSQHSLK
jgi:hypothetical protein